MASKMFPFITVPDWNPLGGECHYNCYRGGCWAKRLIAQYGMTKYKGDARLCTEQMEREFKPGAFVFTCDMLDLFGPWVQKADVLAVLDVIRNTPEAKFLLLTKNPARYLEFTGSLPKNAVLGATVETNVYFESGISYAPSPLDRLEAMTLLADMVKNQIFFSVEPICDFTEPYFAQALTRRWRSLFGVAVGYDNYENHLPEPSLAKAERLIGQLEKAGVRVFRKTLREAWNA